MLLKSPLTRKRVTLLIVMLGFVVVGVVVCFLFVFFGIHHSFRSAAMLHLVGKTWGATLQAFREKKICTILTG